VAILKLCEVELDTNKESVFDKITQLESKLNELEQKGIQVQNMSLAQTNEKPKVLPKAPIRLPEAVPEDILALPAKWGQIVEKLPLGAKLSLGSASPGVLEGDILYIVHAKGMEPSINEHLNAIKAVINELIGKEVKVVPMRDKVYNNKSQELYGSNPEKTKTVVSITDTLQDIQSKVNYDIKQMD
jgi:hypothetical protein